MSYEQFAYAYDRLMRDMPYSEWLEFIQSTIDDMDVQVKTIVDLGCGTGTIAISLAQTGYRLIGIDYSEHMLAVAEQKQQSLAPRATKHPVVWLHQDMRQWELPEQVDMVISLCDCLNYLLEESDILETFRATFAGLRAGGVFLFDVHTLEEIDIYADQQPFFLNEEDVAYIWTNELDRKRMIIEHDLTIFYRDSIDDKTFTRIQETHIQRGYDLTWLTQSLQETGFVDIRLGMDYTWDLPTPYAQRAFLACRKP